MSATADIDLKERARAAVADELRHLDLYELLSLGLIIEELRRAKAAWPTWPADRVHAAGVVAEEAGELMRAALQAHYEKKPAGRCSHEAVQTATVAIRFVANEMKTDPR